MNKTNTTLGLTYCLCDVEMSYEQDEHDIRFNVLFICDVEMIYEQDEHDIRFNVLFILKQQSQTHVLTFLKIGHEDAITLTGQGVVYCIETNMSIFGFHPYTQSPFIIRY